MKEEYNYNRNGSHFHCWNQKGSPACNIPLEKHKQCCLCDTPCKEEECNCEEMTCQKDCDKKHTHKGFWCPKCHPERYSECEHKNIESNMIPDTCRDCGKVIDYEEDLNPVGRNGDNEIPIGVSQWLNHGKKYGYDEFFLGKLIKEIEGKKKKVGDEIHSYKANLAMVYAYNFAIDDIINLIKNLK